MHVDVNELVLTEEEPLAIEDGHVNPPLKIEPTYDDYEKEKSDIPIYYTTQ